MEQKGFLKLGLMSLALVVLIAAGYFFIKKSNMITTVQVASTTENPVTLSPVGGEMFGWVKHSNEKVGFSFKYPQSWKIEDSLKAEAGNVNIFNSQDPYDGSRLRPEVMKAQILRTFNASISSKKQYIDNLVKNNDESDPHLNISRSSIVSVSNEAGLDIFKFTGGVGSFDYVIPLKSDFSEVLYIIVWNPDPKIEKVIGSLKPLEGITVNNKEPDVTTQPVYVVDTFSRDGKNYLELDYIEWFRGTSSIQAQVEDGGCPIVEECRSFPNGYKRNNNPQLRTLEILPSAPIVSDGSLVYYLSKLDSSNFPNPNARGLSISFHDLDLAVSIADGFPYESPFKEPKAFVLVDVNNGVVTKLVEPYQE